jgi:hypothetical protein
MGGEAAGRGEMDRDGDEGEAAGDWANRASGRTLAGVGRLCGSVHR